MTSAEHAEIFDSETGDYGSVRVAPLAAYGVGRLQKEFGKSASTAGVTLTAMQRDLSDEDPLGRILNREAYSGGLNVNHRIAGGKYELSALLGHAEYMLRRLGLPYRVKLLAAGDTGFSSA